MKRTAVVGAVALAVGAAVLLMTRGQGRPQPLNISYADIAKVQAYLVPEGTPPPLFSGPSKSVRTLVR